MRLKKVNWPFYLIASWYIYSVFTLFLVFNLTDFEGPRVRWLLQASVPTALMSGFGIHKISQYTAKNRIPSWVNGTVYTCISSGFLYYLWFIKTSTEWWIRKFNSLICAETITANWLEAVILALPWTLLILSSSFPPSSARKNILRDILKKCKFATKATTPIALAFSFIICVPQAQILSEILVCIKTPDVSYFNELESVLLYVDTFEYVPVVVYYRSVLEDNATTVGFGVTVLENFLDSRFIDLAHPRNWLLYLPLVSNVSSTYLLEYLKAHNIRYFLIPTKANIQRSKFEAALKTSTLFKAIINMCILVDAKGCRFYFIKLAEFIYFELYELAPLKLSGKPLNITLGMIRISQKYDHYQIYYDNEIGYQAVQWLINTSIIGWRALNFFPKNPLNLSNFSKVILCIKSSVGTTILLRFGSGERFWEDNIAWSFSVNPHGWNFVELNLANPDPMLTFGKFNYTCVTLVQLGTSVREDMMQEDVVINFVMIFS